MSAVKKKMERAEFTMQVPAIAIWTDSLTTARKAKNKQGAEVGEAKYGLRVLLDKTSPDVAALRQIVADVAKRQWPGRPFQGNPDNDIKALAFPFKNGDAEADKSVKDGKADRPHLRGKVIINPKSPRPPRLSVMAGGRIIDLDTPELLEMHKSKFYDGVQVAINVNVTAYESGDNDGVTLYINSVLSLNKGDRMSGGRPAAETFKSYVGQMSAVNPLGTEADEMVF